MVGAYAFGEAGGRENLDFGGPAGQPALQPWCDGCVQVDVQAAVQPQLADLGWMNLVLGDQAGSGGAKAQANDFGFAGPGAESPCNMDASAMSLRRSKVRPVGRTHPARSSRKVRTALRRWHHPIR